MSPTGPRNIRPPVIRIAQVGTKRRLLENYRRRHEEVRLCSRIILNPWRAFRERHVTCLLDKARELRVGNRALVEPKTVYCHLMGWCFFRIVIVRSHQKTTAGYPDHLFEWWFARSGAVRDSFRRSDID